MHAPGFTAIVVGFVVSLLGGSRFQIGGPAGAFIVLLAAAVAACGIDGLILATVLSGAMDRTFAFAWGVQSWEEARRYDDPCCAA